MEELRSFAGALRVGGVIVYPLLLLAVLSTIVVLEKVYVFVARARMPAGVLRTIGADGVAWAAFEHASRVAPDARIHVIAFSAVLEAKPTWADAYLNKERIVDVVPLLTALIAAGQPAAAAPD